jgi:nitric oxide reductase NorQ protein
MRTLTPPVDALTIADAPWYLPTGDEVAVFEAAAAQGLPVLLTGPTGTGKTRFVAHMAHRLGRPLVTVACHDDLTAADLVGRYLLLDDETVWMDGPLTAGVRHGAIVYLDEVVEARPDTLVVLHPLTDHRRMLPLDKRGEVLRAGPGFQLVCSYNPGLHSAFRALKPSTRQRFVALDMQAPPPDAEARIIAHEARVDAQVARVLAGVGAALRRLVDRGLEGGVGTRALVHAGQLTVAGLSLRAACAASLTRALTDDPDLRQAIAEVLDDRLPPDDPP